MARLKALLFFLLVPGTIFVYLPLALGCLGFANPNPLLLLRILALPAWLLGLGSTGWCIWAFLRLGNGTPAPNEPPTELVAGGPYRYTRNPMYQAGLLILLGYALWFQSWLQWLYLLILVIFFHFVVTFEERELQRRYGAAYLRYCEITPRWGLRLRKSQKKVKY